MKSSMWLLATLSLFLVGALTLGACAPVAPSAPGGEAAEEAIVLEVWRPAGAAGALGNWWDDDGEILEMWAEEHPNVEIRIEELQCTAISRVQWPAFFSRISQRINKTARTTKEPNLIRIAIEPEIKISHVIFHIRILI